MEMRPPASGIRPRASCPPRTLPDASCLTPTMQDVAAWYDSLLIVGLGPHRASLVGVTGMDGPFVRDKWSLDLLISANLNQLQAEQLLRARDLLRGTQKPTTPGASEGAPPDKIKSYVKLGLEGLRLVLDKVGTLTPYDPSKFPPHVGRLYFVETVWVLTEERCCPNTIMWGRVQLLMLVCFHTLSLRA